MEKDIEFKIPFDLFDNACANCGYYKNSSCTGECIKKFMSETP